VSAKRKVPTREEFIALIDRASVPESEWHDRDSASAQIQLGKARMLLLAGCEYTIDPGKAHDCWWLEFTVHDFGYFETGDLGWESAYIPTAERLDKAKGEDWY
jgi:hypothetical protein